LAAGVHDLKELITTQRHKMKKRGVDYCEEIKNLKYQSSESKKAFEALLAKLAS
jgi:hypothetical protein